MENCGEVQREGFHSESTPSTVSERLVHRKSSRVDDGGDTNTLVSCLTEPSVANTSLPARFSAGIDQSLTSYAASSSTSSPSPAKTLPLDHQRKQGNPKRDNRNKDGRYRVCGRHEETRLIQSAFDRVIANHTSEVVAIHGASGVGKSTLVESFRHSLVLDHNAFFVRGKYDQLGQAAEPYGALIAAFTEICDFYAMPQHHREATLFRERLFRTLRTEVHVLSNLIFNLEVILRSNDDTTEGNWPRSNDQTEVVSPPMDSKQQEQPLSSTDKPGREGENVSKQDTKGRTVNTTREHFMTMSQASVRFKQLCQTFLRLAATQDHPVLLFLDDVQWADEPSLGVITSLMADRQSKHVLLVMTYRDDDSESKVVADRLGLVHSNDKASSTPERAESHQRLELTNLLLGNLELQGVKDIVEKILFASCRDTSHNTDELAELLMQKTEGNVFFLLQLLDNLQDKDLLTCGINGWEWDLARIQAETNVADNVVGLIFSRLHQLDTDVIRVLQLASFLGYHFDFTALLAVAVAENERTQRGEANSLAIAGPWMNMKPTDAQREWLEGLLEEITHQNLVEATSIEGRYKFSHDRVQQCLYELTPGGDERTRMHFCIGLALWNSLAGDEDGEKHDDRFLFLAADHLGEGCHLVVDREDKLLLTRLYHRVGKVAAAKAAFASARKYIMTGISLLDADAQWGEETYNLTLDLHSTLAEILNSSGSFSQSQTVSEEVLRNAKGLSDKTRCYWSLATALGSQGKVMQSAEVSFDFLRQLGEHFPKRPTQAHVAMEMLRTLQVVARKSDEAILNLPLMADEKKIAAMNILGNISLNVYLHFAAKNIFVMVGLRMMRLSCVHGLTNMSTFGVANFAMVLSVFGFHDRACRFGELALKLSERLSARDTLARTLAILNHFVMHWRHPLVEGIAAFERTYLLGMETGDIEFAFAGAVGHISFMFYASPNVAFVQQEATDVINLLEDFQHELAGAVIRPCSQIALNLMGCAENPAILTGEAMNEDEMEQFIQSHENVVIAYNHDLIRLQLATFFESYPRMKKYLKKVDRFLISIRGSFMQYASPFMIGLCNYCLYRKFGKRKYRVRGRQLCRVVERMANQGCENAIPFYLLLEAERLSLLGDKDAAIGAYEAAFANGRQNGSLCYEAMSYERAAIALAPDLPELASEYMLQATELWKSWEAHGKVEMLEFKYHHLIHCGSRPTKPKPNILVC